MKVEWENTENQKYMHGHSIRIRWDKTKNLNNYRVTPPHGYLELCPGKSRYSSTHRTLWQVNKLEPKKGGYAL